MYCIFLSMFCHSAEHALFGRTFGELHQGSKCPRHNGDTSVMFSTCSCKYRWWIFAVIMPLVIWVIHRRCSRTARWSIDDAIWRCFRLHALFSISTQKYANSSYKSDLFFSHDVIRYPQCMWLHVKSLHFLYTRHYAIAMTPIFVCCTAKDHRPSPILIVYRSL